ncbi:camk protein kinase [Plasmopara halstedii]|uniref:Camk protein kinase n=1 Tax=Plasmopara halstedii TaxID=4781 RepID=A0A0N7L546_PLAHL|nr:camk protein kinase [Plasmopara halstedii]CEG40459.1 camk protein kinase [Plasmopara halstedii]|eukprot:XP_024576828.1 camk protein kinase [Plasmopara halstedii]
MGLFRNYMDAMLSATFSSSRDPSCGSTTLPKKSKKKLFSKSVLEPVPSPTAKAQTIIQSPPKRLSELKMMGTLAPALFGEVLVCLDTRVGRYIAVKRVNMRCAEAQLTVDQHIQVVESLQQERAVHRRLVAAKTTNLVLLEEEVHYGGHLYLIFPYCSGGDLFNAVRRSPMNGRLFEGTTRRFMRHIVRGLQCLKQNGLAHRDISLENILLDTDNVCHICDFGLASEHGKLLAPGRVGKVWYMAPEVFAVREPYDPLSADIWSLGVLLAIMLTGVPLVRKPTNDDRHFCVLSHGGGVRELRHIFPSKLSENVWDLMDKLLTIDPQRRPTLEQVAEHPFLSLDYTNSEVQSGWP